MLLFTTHAMLSGLPKDVVVSAAAKSVMLLDSLKSLGCASANGSRIPAEIQRV
jgi:hypothetical protein